jgi:hypothetical protein
MRKLVDLTQKNMKMKFENKELIVLKPEFDDKNYKRVYQITAIKKTTESERLFVKIISEKSTDPGKFPEKSENLKNNKILGPFSDHLFNPYL